jgi:hypothetical protein
MKEEKSVHQIALENMVDALREASETKEITYQQWMAIWKLFEKKCQV